MTEETRYDVAIVGGGPAGLSAALVLGRCRRRVVVFDDARPRNARSHGVHGFLTRDGIPPAELREIGRAQLSPYDVTIIDASVEDAQHDGKLFHLVAKSGARFVTRKLLLATGIRDCVPSIPGLDALYGSSVVQCAYCDGWEFRDRPLGAYGGGKSCGEFALALTTWSRDVILFTDGHESPAPELVARMARHGVRVRTEHITELAGEGNALRFVVLEGGERVERAALFVHLGQHQRSPLAEKLGCPIDSDELVDTCDMQKTSIAGLYVAGDAARDVKFAIVAAAQGARAAHAINQELREEDTP